MTIVALIPARGGSKRLPRKNVLPVHGRPLVAYPVEAALSSGLFTGVYVSTDDAEIAAEATKAGALLHDRPKDLATDTTTVVHVSLSFADWYEQTIGPIDVLCVILPTALLLRGEDLSGGLAVLLQADTESVMSVTTYLESPFQALHDQNGYLRPYFPEFGKRSQDLPPVQVDSGYFYFMHVPALRAQRSFYTRHLRGYAIPRDRSIDIDEPAHLRLATAMLDASAPR